MNEPIPRAQWAQTSQLTKFSQWASISHLAQWAQTECVPRVIQISRWLKAQWASISHEAQWVRTECFPHVIPISQSGPSFILGPVGPRRMFSQCKPDQPVAVVPVGQSFTPGPVGPCGIVSKCEPNDPIADSPVGSTETPDPVDETDRPIQIDFMKIVPTDRPASLVDTPPSSDLGIHSWGEQWENMSISTADTEAEQNGRQRICSPTGWRVSDTRVPPNTEEDEVINCPWIDCLLKGESDELSSSGIRNYNKDPQCDENIDFNSDREPTSDESSWEDYEACSDDLVIISKERAPEIRNVTICRKENSSVGSGTDGRNSDIGDLADFSADEEESQVEQFSGCRIPGCQCEGRIEYMEWDSDDMTDSEDSEWEDPDERANRLWVEQYNYDLIEGMTLMTYTPPPRKNRRRRYEDNVKYAPEVQESNCRTSEMGFQTEEESPQLEPALQPRTDADEDISSCRDKKDNYGPQKRAGSDTYFPSEEHSEFFDRPVTESMTARAGSDTDFPSGEHSEFFDRPVTESVTAQAGSDTDFPSGEHSEFVDRPVTESVTARAADTEEILVMNVSTVATEQSELREMVLGETNKRGIPVCSVECTPEHRRPENISPGALQHVEMSNNQRNCVDYCCGVCGKADSVNRSGTGSCWNCCCLIVWGYRVSCLAAIVIKDRLYGIDLFTEDHRVYYQRTGVSGQPCDAV